MSVGRAFCIGLAAALAVLACAQPRQEAVARPGGPAPRPPIILISIDTLRADRLPAWGHDAVETPAIDRLAADGVLFERAWTHVNVTLPSHVSLFTGLLPPDHGVRDNTGFRLGHDVPTLAAELESHGYLNGGFVSSWVLRSWTGIDRGFHVWDDDVGSGGGRQLGDLQRPGSETLAAAADWLREAAGRPFFLFFHLYEPHAPYEPPAPFADRYDDPYDGEVAAADQVVGGLLTLLHELGLYDEALVILLSDHGEGLMDHGEMDHLILIYREVLQVPLIVKLPGNERRGERVARNVQLTDVAPTMYSLLGLDHPPDMAGSDLLGPSPAVPPQIISESVYPRIHFGWSDLASVVEGDLHFIDSPAPELFRLSEDPREIDNVVEEERAAARRMRAALEAVDRTLVPPAERANPETLQRLQSLGYLSGGARAGSGPLPDPKARLWVVEELDRAGALATAGELAAAEPLLRRILDTEPQLVRAWEQLGDVLEGQDREEEALAAWRRAVDASGGDAAGAAVKVAELLLRTGRVDEAREHALAAVDRSPLAHQVLAEAALIEGDLQAVERHLETAVAERGPRVTPLIVRVAWLNALGRFKEALAQADEALSEFGDRGDRQNLARLLLYRGTALGALDRVEDAERAWREAAAMDEGLLGAWSSLAFLLALQGRTAEAGLTLQEMVTVNPQPAAWVEAVRTLRAMEDEQSAEILLSQALQRWPDSPELLRARDAL